MSDDIRPTADDMARDLRADLEFLRGAWGPSAAGYGAAAVRRDIAAEAEVARLRATAMNNRLAALERMGLAVSRRYGRQRLYRAVNGGGA